MKIRIPLMVAAALSYPVSGSAQGPQCGDSETLPACYQRMYNEALGQAAVERPQAAERQGANQLAEASTGGNSAAAPSTLTDLLPLLTMSGLVSNLSDDNETGVISGNINLPILTGLGNDLQIKGTLDTKPDLFSSLFDGLATADSIARLGTLEEGLPELSDFRLDVTYSATQGRFGRSFAKYRDWFQILFRGVECKAGLRCTTEEAAGQAPDLTDLLDIVGAILQESPDIPDDWEFMTSAMSELTDQDRSLLSSALHAAAVVDARVEQALEEVYASTNLDDFYRLVNNQPQLTGGVLYHYRDERVGQTEFGFRGGFEIGFANLNNFLEQASASCGTSLAPARDMDRSTLVRCIDAYTRYMQQNQRALERGDRLFFGLEYDRINDYEFLIPGTATPVMMESSTKWKITGGYGRYVDFGSGSVGDRVDFLLDYESNSSDMRNDRFVASLTLTHKVAGMSVPLGIVYANKGEFLGEVDGMFGAHVGLKLDLGGGRGTN